MNKVSLLVIENIVVIKNSVFKQYKFLLILLLIVFFTGCNKASHDVEPTYISAYKYENKSCDSLKRELTYVQERANTMVKRVDDRKDSQDTKLAFGWLFWPSYLVIDDNTAEANELAKLKGEHRAISNVIDEKNCRVES